MVERRERRRAPEVKEKPSRHVPQVAIIDFDRTLGDVDASMKRFYNAAEFVGVNAAHVKSAQTKTEADGGTFEPLSFVKDQLDEEGYAAFKNHFITADGPSIMYPESQPFLDMLTEKNMPFVVRTWGVSAEWQHLKIAAAGYTGAYEVMDKKDKGAEIESWRQETADGNSIIVVPDHPSSPELITADSAVLIDDKASSFKSLNRKDTGFWIVPKDGELLKSQQGDVPANVQKTSLDELTVVEGHIVKKALPNEGEVFNAQEMKDGLPEGIFFSTELTEKHIEQLVAFSTDTEDVGVQNNTSDKKRFKDREAVNKWIEKGRSVVVLTDDEGDLLGISWLGAEDINLDNRELLPSFDPAEAARYGVTFAIRTYEKARGKGLSRKLAQQAERQFETTAEYQKLVKEGKQFPWLEVSADNIPAVKSYSKNGYVQITARNEEGKILMVQKEEPQK